MIDTSDPDDVNVGFASGYFMSDLMALFRIDNILALWLFGKNVGFNGSKWNFDHNVDKVSQEECHD